MVTKNKMIKRIIYGSILAAFLMVSIAFIQPVSASDREPVDLIQTPDYNMQEVEALVEMISSDKQILSFIEPLLQDEQISLILEQMQVATGPDEMYVLLTEFETILVEMDLDPELGNILIERYGTENEIIEKTLPGPLEGITVPFWVIILIAIITIIAIILDQH